MTATARRGRRPGPPPTDGRQQHLGWLAMVEPTGPFLTLPVLLQVWPTLDALEPEARDKLRAAHDTWRTDPDGEATSLTWIWHVLRNLLDWREDVETDPAELATLAATVAEHEVTLTPSFALVEPGERLKPDACRLLGLILPPGSAPTVRLAGDTWAATPADRLAHLCRVHGVELGLATDGRWWTLVWAPRGGVTTTVTFDAVSWPEQADRDLLRAFRSLLCRRRFFSVPDDETLIPLLRKSLENQEEVTEALGAQVRRAVELLVDAIGRWDTRDRQAGADGLGDLPAQDVYRGAVAVMMRVVFLLFAEERGLLPADNDLYAQAYSAGRLAERLEQRAREGSEEQLEHSHAGWLRLLALFTAVHGGVRHPRLTLPAYDGSIFDPEVYPWLARVRVDDRTILHMLRSVQYVQIKRELRRLSFRALDVEEIGYVYEGLLSFEGRRASDTVVGLIGKAGKEEEVPLAALEAHAAGASDPAALAGRLAEAYKDSGIGTLKALTKKLAPMDEAERAEALRRLLAVTNGDLALAERLLPFAGILRTDLRGLPMVFLQDSLYVTESRLRKNTGTHYTPRFLAEQVVEGALEPLVYSPGPLQTADKDAWVLRSPAEILSLKVADIAMGSGAFLVAACRYLAAKLVEARARAGDETAWKHHNDEYGERPAVDTEADPVLVAARREIIEHCLYGVDINEMAVEMAKLSLWLVSMDPHRPFTFLDDRLAVGDSLLGITSLEQLEYLHLDPAEGRRLHEDPDALFDATGDVRALAAEVAAQRAAIAALPDDAASLPEKRRLLAEAEAKTEQARLYADLVVGAALATAGKGARAREQVALEAAEKAMSAAKGTPEGQAKARDAADTWLATDAPGEAFPRQPLHWPLVFPEVFADDGGFAAIIGNPPFLGGKKISGAAGGAYREYIVGAVGRGVKVNADLIAYFVLRAHSLLGGNGQAGLIATNTLAQGDTREVGLEQIVAAGVEIWQAEKSKPWPARSAALEYCAVWMTNAPLGEGGQRRIDGRLTSRITSSLEAESRVSGNAERLVANRGVAFQGSIVLGMGFAMTPDMARLMLEKDDRNRMVLFPYIGGEDLNQRHDCSASRWVVNFGELDEGEARTWHDPWKWIEERVKPDRLSKDAKKYPRMVQEWWKYWNPRPALLQAVRELERVAAIARHSKSVMPAMVPTGQVYSDATVVFATDDLAMLGLLSSAPHYWWAISRASTMKGDLRYTPTDVFETFARPELTQELRELGERLDTYRRDSVMLARQAGLTATYNLVHDPACKDADIAELRRIHVVIDQAVMRAYGWDDLELDHGHHETRQGVRYTVGPVVRQEILDRLLELNHERYAAEVAAGLHDKKTGGKRVPRQAAAEQGSLFDV
ncbi:SAM-dependent DNA methyltransferase [Natronosporangium hydrolyticum]|uniref:site-specific DNA-methyltransferase (adenine-specific) n=1 Tax=Natronosporangium hydrolyticum TaxID=2811111 RepID=A0A895YPM8_9ACTN|nr:DNA methyltransferase [Natronosporangium hydrolyticum]QSB16686.1 SAM-dependent DNA methyltransferase [Natronosporangium hydrolyticum]